MMSIDPDMFDNILSVKHQDQYLSAWPSNSVERARAHFESGQDLKSTMVVPSSIRSSEMYL